MAQRIQAMGDSIEQQITQAYLLAYSRPPSTKEVADAKRFLVSNAHSGHKKLPLKQFCHAMIAAAEFRYIP